MKILLKKVEVVDPASSFHGQVVDILVNRVRIEQIDKTVIAEDAQIFDCGGLSISLGWMDLQTTVGDPGFEYKEDVASLAASAAHGGFTSVCVLPNTQPVIQSKEGVSYLKNKAQFSIVELNVIGALTKDAAGKDLTEMIDMMEQGAVAFSDGKNGTAHAGVLLKGLQYLYKAGKTVITRPFDPYLCADGLVHEGVTSTMNGMKGIPSVAEVITIKRDLEILEYAGGKLHFSAISTKQGVDLIREAKSKGLNVTCDVAVPNLVLNDESMINFDTHYKVFPPLRSESDRKGLIQGVIDGVIDCIVTDHSPQDVDAKKLEFDYADFGMIGLESAFGLLISKVPEIPVGVVIEKLTSSPRKILGLECPRIEEDQITSLTLFDKNEEWEFTQDDIKSKCSNTPFLGEKLKGRAKYIINKGQVQQVS